MKLFLGQINPKIGDLDYNFKKIISFVEEAKKQGGDLIIFPELALIGYPPKDILFKHDLIEQQNYYLDELKLYSDENFAIIVGGILENKGYGRALFNSMFCLANGEIEETASKTLLPTYDIFDETRYFESYDKNKSWTWKGKKFGLSICEDIWIESYPNLYRENPVEKLVSQEPDYIINIAASPYSYGKSFKKQKLIESLVEKYKTPIIYVNQVGANDQLIFDGASRIFNKDAELQAIAKSFKEELLCLDLDSNEKLEQEFNQEENILKSPGNKALTELEQALILGIQDYVHKCGFSKMVLGLSGGIDSALVAYLASKALGKENLYAYMLPSRFTSESSINDAKQLAKKLEINYEIIPIVDLHSTMKDLMPELEGLADENLQSRLRANILMAKANSLNAMLVATGNKSEIAVGYSTLYGDSCGAIAVIGDLLKTTVYQLSKHINQEEEIIPQNIIDKAPSAELREDQKDSDSLPDYEIMDQIIHLYVQELRSFNEICEHGFDPELTKQVINLIDRAEYKRQQAPPILKISGKAFGIGRRLPIAQGYQHK